MRTLLTLILLLALTSGLNAAGVERVDISPSVLVNMAEGHSGKTMGGAVTGDVFFSKHWALRTTVGFTKNRNFPAEADYGDAEYGFWLSFAPYAELNIGDRARPYLALLGTFTTGSSSRYLATPIGMEQSPYARLQQDSRRDSYYSLGVTAGSKLKVAGPVSVYAEISHFFFTSLSDSEVYFGPGEYLFDRQFDFERNPTYLSLGLTFSINTSRQDQ
ncbi:MAG: hypothetical protein GY867_02900 [bacterium]|nr:hypothetical protein [bacterium]